MIRAIAFDNFGVLYTHGLNQPVAQLIEQLRPRYQTALLSNSSVPSLEHLLGAHTISRLFDVVVASAEAGYSKPEREIFELCTRRLGVDFGELLFVDDWPGHVNGATSYGIRSILYKSPEQLEQALTEANIRLTP
jgi:HAD superfamily hydrolase (TIGR01509 family)